MLRLNAPATHRNLERPHTSAAGGGTGKPLGIRKWLASKTAVAAAAAGAAVLRRRQQSCLWGRLAAGKSCLMPPFWGDIMRRRNALGGTISASTDSQTG